MSDKEIVNQLFLDVKRVRKDLEFMDARVKVALNQKDLAFLEQLYQHQNEIELLKKSTEILLQRMENGNYSRDIKGRKGVDSGFGGSGGSALLEPLFRKQNVQTQLHQSTLICRHRQRTYLTRMEHHAAVCNSVGLS